MLITRVEGQGICLNHEAHLTVHAVCNDRAMVMLQDNETGDFEFFQMGDSVMDIDLPGGSKVEVGIDHIREAQARGRPVNVVTFNIKVVKGEPSIHRMEGEGH